MLDLAVIGAGPCGLAVGVAAKRARLTCSLFDKGPVASSLMRYPLYMTFFSTPEKLEIGVPFVTAGDKPTRREALAYYRRVAEHFELDVRQYHEVVVVGGGNSAVEAALELHRVGARVTIVHFLGEFDRGVKPWVLPDITNRVKDRSVAARWLSRVVEIRPREVIVRSETDGTAECLPAEFVLAMTGYRADLSLLRMAGVTVDEKTGVPQHDPATMQTNVPGVFIAGVLASGLDANRIFIENGRAHGGLICGYLKAQPPRVAPGG